MERHSKCDSGFPATPFSVSHMAIARLRVLALSFAMARLVWGYARWRTSLIGHRYASASFVHYGTKKQSDLRRQTRQHDSDECGLAHAARLASMFLRHSPSYPLQQHETPAEVTFSNTKRALPIGKRPQILLPQFSGFIFRRWLRRADGPLGRQLVRLASSR